MADMEFSGFVPGAVEFADILRSKMDASEYKNYLLGLVFYKYLSDRLLYMQPMCLNSLLTT